MITLYFFTPKGSSPQKFFKWNFIFSCFNLFSALISWHLSWQWIGDLNKEKDSNIVRKTFFKKVATFPLPWSPITVLYAGLESAEKSGLTIVASSKTKKKVDIKGRLIAKPYQKIPCTFFAGYIIGLCAISCVFFSLPWRKFLFFLRSFWFNLTCRNPNPFLMGKYVL